MARTTAAEVLQILDNSSLSETIVDAYIVGANALVTKVLSNSGLGDTLLEEIERWLTAHMIVSTRERMAAEEGAGGAKIKYTGEWGQGLKSTPYGQQAMALDTTGGLASLALKKATITAVETEDW